MCARLFSGDVPRIPEINLRSLPYFIQPFLDDICLVDIHVPKDVKA